MDRMPIKEEARVTGVRPQTPPLRMPDAASTAEVVVAQAMEYCARKMGLAGAEEAMERVRKGDPCAHGYCYYSIAKQVAEAMASLDRSIRAVYVFDYDATPSDLCFHETVQTTPIHLLVWTERKTEALGSLAGALDHALARKLCTMLGCGPQEHILDVQIIDDSDVEKQTGYGALLCSIHHRPIKVWER